MSVPSISHNLEFPNHLPDSKEAQDFQPDHCQAHDLLAICVAYPTQDPFWRRRGGCVGRFAGCALK